MIAANVHHLIIDNCAWDMRKVVFWSDDINHTGTPVATVKVQFMGYPTIVHLPKVAFEAAKEASLAAGG